MKWSATLHTPWLTNHYITHALEVYFRPFVWDNIGSWQIFEDDRYALNILNFVDEFINHNVDEIQEGEEVPITQLKSNKIPKGIVLLEDLFYRFDAFKGTNKSSLDDQVDEVDIGNKDTPRITKVAKGCTSEEKEKIVRLLK
jgi:hypothetical protein